MQGQAPGCHDVLLPVEIVSRRSPLASRARMWRWQVLPANRPLRVAGTGKCVEDQKLNEPRLPHVIPCPTGSCRVGDVAACTWHQHAQLVAKANRARRGYLLSFSSTWPPEASILFTMSCRSSSCSRMYSTVRLSTRPSERPCPSRPGTSSVKRSKPSRIACLRFCSERPCYQECHEGRDHKSGGCSVGSSSGQ